jgi:hypothetical protein
VFNSNIRVCNGPEALVLRGGEREGFKERRARRIFLDIFLLLLSQKRNLKTKTEKKKKKKKKENQHMKLTFLLVGSIPILFHFISFLVGLCVSFLLKMLF